VDLGTVAKPGASR